MKRVLKDILNIKLIEEYIKNNNLSKAKFCELCKINYYTLRKVLNGENFDVRVLMRIAKVMNSKVHNLFNQDFFKNKK